ncbi:MAG TPA: SRPBCC family protein [Candidatus Angelobacter sp.]|nr:SRPBCC family protein [Candidatus Angelobacter sp.]
MKKGSNPQVREQSQIVRVEYTDVTLADRSLAWRVFSDFRRWRKFSDIYGEIRWFTGKPWKAGSRMRIDLVRPVKTSVDHVITVSRPGECVAWIDHFLGNTMEQWVTFSPQPDGTTCVHTWAEVTGATSLIGGQNFGEMLKNFIELWYSRFCQECNRMHEREYAIW